MSTDKPLTVFGEVLYDMFPEGPPVLGGAPFNVAWHLQAFGDVPCFVSRVGRDKNGDAILSAMRDWGMDTSHVQTDEVHATGWVDIQVTDGQPNYTITPDVAYDFIDASLLSALPRTGILYHGSLAIRSDVSRAAFETLTQDASHDIFFDVNLRDPWWNGDRVLTWLKRARWAKMNEDELVALGYNHGEVRDDMAALQSSCPVEHVIVTRGNRGVLVRHTDGTFYEAEARPLERRVDFVGAGDAFSAMYLHGVRAGWPIQQIVERARDFAEALIGVRGATPQDRAFYKPFI